MAATFPNEGRDTSVRRRDLRVALVNPEFDAPSETFIRAHSDHLAGEVFFFSGAPWFLDLRNAPPLPVHNRRLREWARAACRQVFGAEAPARPRVLAAESVAFVTALRDNAVDVVLAEFGPTAVGVLPACVRARVPLVVHFHGFDASRQTTLDEYRVGYRAVFEYASTIVVVSGAMEGALEALGAPREKLLLNPYGPLEAFFGVEPDPASRTILAVGRFVGKKGPLHTLRAFSRVAERHPGVRLVMAGDGPLLGQARELTHELGLRDRVAFPGPVSHEQVLQLMAEATIFAQHSRADELGDCEGTPVAILEAHAAGLPVVSTRHGGIPEAVIDGATGMLVDEGDEEGMARALDCLLADPALGRRMGLAGRVHVKENYSIERHISLLDRALAEAAGRA